ncbi:MAG: ABC transporter permease [Rubrobacter sp.]|nr:ABC transporter permease [Rubrobacter sp.]
MSAPDTILGFLVRRIPSAIAILFLATTGVFFLTEILPGDAASAILGNEATPERLENLRTELGLDRPVTERYLEWLGGLLTGDLGNSIASELPVEEFIAARIGNSLLLALMTMSLLVPLAVGLGVLAALRPGSVLDRLISSSSVALDAVPEFAIAIFMVVCFGLWLGILPPVSLVGAGESPLASPEILILPVVVLLLRLFALGARVVRAGMIEALDSEYVATARLWGVRERRVVLRHALPNALAPATQVFARNLDGLLGGIIVVEAVFGYPGLAQGLLDAVSARDVPLVQALAVLFAAVTIFANLLADLLTIMLVPRARETVGG